MITWTDAAREQAFTRWLATCAARHGLDAASARPASADASFRRYFRVDGAPGNAAGACIVMDAPPSHEDCRPFVRVAQRLRGAGLNAPRVIEWDEAQGFMLLSDLGSTTYLERLRQAPQEAEALYRAAHTALVHLQGIAAEAEVPPYDHALLQREMDLFAPWYVARHLQATLTPAEEGHLQRAMAALLDNNLAQGRVLVHRDWHSRNLMVCDAILPDAAGVALPHPGILDFQDAVWGPITYDLVSILRDAYVEWSEEVQIDRAARYWEAARKAALPVPADFGAFWRDFEWMGLQRHLKVLGIFARLCHRDGKDGYLKDLPLVWRHAHHVACRYREFAGLAKLLERLAGLERSEGFTF